MFFSSISAPLRTRAGSFSAGDPVTTQVEPSRKTSRSFWMKQKILAQHQGTQKCRKLHCVEKDLMTPLSIYPSIHLSIYLSVYVYVYMYIYIYTHSISTCQIFPPPAIQEALKISAKRLIGLVLISRCMMLVRMPWAQQSAEDLPSLLREPMLKLTSLAVPSGNLT